MVVSANAGIFEYLFRCLAMGRPFVALVIWPSFVTMSTQDDNIICHLWWDQYSDKVNPGDRKSVV